MSIWIFRHTVSRATSAVLLIAIASTTAATSAASSAASTTSNSPAPVQSVTPLRDHIDPARLRPSRDSFVVLMQGKPSGWQRLTVSRDGDGWTLSDAVTIGTMVSQASTIRLGPDLEERSLRQEGVMQGKSMEIALDFANGRVRGSAVTPTHPEGPITIDTAVTRGTIDDNAVMSLLAAVRWRDSLALTIPVLASGKGTIDEWQLRVLGTDMTTVPAGQFETWRVEMRTERSRSIVHVSRAAPHRVVRIVLGPAFEMQLVP